MSRGNCIRAGFSVLVCAVPAWFISFSLAYPCTVLFVEDEASSHFSYLDVIVHGGPMWGYAWMGIQIIRMLLYLPVLACMSLPLYWKFARKNSDKSPANKAPHKTETGSCMDGLRRQSFERVSRGVDSCRLPPAAWRRSPNYDAGACGELRE